jgi:hypothetical protein
MAYVPDEWLQVKWKLSPTSHWLLLYYCSRADQDEGTTTVSVERTAKDLSIRKDHVNEADRRLVRHGFISLDFNEEGGRVITLRHPWQSRTDRKQPRVNKTTSQVLGENLEHPEAATQNLGSPLNSHPSFGEITQNLGESTQNLGDFTLNLGKSTQNLGAHIRNNQLINQLIEPEEEAPPPAFSSVPENDSETEMAEAVATVMGFPSLPEGNGGAVCFEAAREFISAGIPVSILSEFEKQWYSRKIASGKTYVLTLAILRSDLPGWWRARQFQQASSPKVIAFERSLDGLSPSQRKKLAEDKYREMKAQQMSA